MSYQEAIEETVKDIKRLRDVDRIIGHFTEYEFIDTAKIHGVDMGEGIAEIDLDAPNHLYDQVLKEIIGTEKQSEELVRYLMQDFEDDPLSIWQSDIFGRSLSSIVREGIHGKLTLMPENVRHKLKDTLEKIINEGSGGMIAIIL